MVCLTYFIKTMPIGPYRAEIDMHNMLIVYLISILLQINGYCEEKKKMSNLPTRQIADKHCTNFHD